MRYYLPTTLFLINSAITAATLSAGHSGLGTFEAFMTLWTLGTILNAQRA